MGKVLSQHQIESYHKKGFISLIDVMSEDEAHSYAEKLKAAETQYPRDLTGVNRNNGHLCFKFLDELAYHPVVLDASLAVDLILKPGQMSLHHAIIIHGSQPNQSQDQRRIGFALQSFMPAGAKQTIGYNNWSPVRGYCAQQGHTYLPRPQQDMASSSVQVRDQSNQNFSDIPYHGAKIKRDY